MPLGALLEATRDASIGDERVCGFAFVPAPCATSGSSTSALGTSGAGGLRFCKDYLYAPSTAPTPGLLATIYNNASAPTTPNTPDTRGTIQKYVSCYYQGYELDSSQPQSSYTTSPTTNFCTLGNPTRVHNMCSIIPNHLNNNTSEAQTNMAGTSCGQYATIKVQFLDQCPTLTIPNPPLTVPSPTASQAAFLASQNLSVNAILSNPNFDVSTLATNVSAQQAQQLSGKKACVAYTLPQPNPGATPADPSWDTHWNDGDLPPFTFSQHG